MTTRNFDVEREARLASLELATFVMRGNEFTVRDDVNPNVIMLFEQLGNRDSDKSQGEQMQMVDDVMLGLVMPQDATAYLEMRATDSPGLMELVSAAQWCLEQITNRPFEPSSGSTTSATGQTSPAASTEPPFRVVVGESGISASGTGAT